MSITTISVVGGFIISALTIVGSVLGNYYTKKKEMEIIIEKSLQCKMFLGSHLNTLKKPRSVRKDLGFLYG
jgi:hypothetical protein